MFLVDLGAQTCLYPMQHFFIGKIFLIRHKLRRHHCKKIFCRYGIKKRTKIYRNSRADRTIVRHAVQTFLIYTPHIGGNQILIDAHAVSVADLLECGNLYITMNDTKLLCIQLFTLDLISLF